MKGPVRLLLPALAMSAYSLARFGVNYLGRLASTVLAGRGVAKAA